MELLYLLKGLAVGFLLAVPVGPIGVLCIRRTLAHGARRGIATGLAAASADMMYGIIAAFGLSLVSDFILAQQFWFRLIGGSFLLAIGVRTFFAHPEREIFNNGSNGHTSTYLGTFILTLTNPMTMIAFAAVFASIGIAEIRGSTLAALLLVIGVFFGSLLWFMLLTETVHLFKEKLSTNGIVSINRASGILIFVFGIIALGTLWLHFLPN